MRNTGVQSKDGKINDETDALSNFQNTLHKSALALGDSLDCVLDGEEGAEKRVEQEDPGMEIDDDRGFLSHALCFPDDSQKPRRAERDYEVIGSRQRGVRAKDKGRERKRKLGRHYRH